MEDNIKVVVRTRPLNKRESSGNCANIVTCNEAEHSVYLNCKPEGKQFAFDHVAGEESTQESIFHYVGVPLTESCLQGFNGTIIAYGQTGSGKTHTLFGSTGNNQSDSDQRGLVPRVFEYLWQKMTTAESSQTAAAPSYSCKCSFYEIYNERVLDLLDGGVGSGAGNNNNHNPAGLSIREDSKKGVYVDGITEAAVSSPADASRVLNLGYRNRHVSSTAMNRDSSRSHAVFLLTVTVTSTNSSGLRTTNSATFSLVDLAGSERQKATQTEGLRLKEASKINQSLSTLGSVIHALSMGSGSNQSNFVRYRDSALTFLLRDSLGGNSKTVLIAAISPSSDAMSETLGTLKFAQRAKAVRNVVSANSFTSGTIEALHKEIRELRSQLEAYASSSSLPLPPDLPSLGTTTFADNDRKSILRNSVSGNSSVNSSNKGVHLTPPGLIFMSICDKATLSESLQRFAAVDAARIRAELRAHALAKQLEIVDKTTNGMQSSPPVAFAESDIGAATNEVIRLKQRCWELENRLTSALEEKEMASQQSIWSCGQEATFGASLVARIADAEQKCKELDRQYTQIVNNAFVTATGLTADEAKSLQDRCQALTIRAENEEKQNGQLNIRLLQLEQALADSPDHLMSVGETSVKLLRMYQDRAGMLGEDLHAWHSNALTATASAALNNKRHAAAIARVAEEEASCRTAEENLRSLQSQLLQSSLDMQTREFERDEALERAETAETLCESLRSENSDLQTTIRMLTVTLASFQSQLSNAASSVSKQDSSVALSEIAHLKEKLAAEITAKETAEFKANSALDDLALSRDVIADLSRENHMQGQLARERQLQLEEASNEKVHLLVAKADVEQEYSLVTQRCASLENQILGLQKELQNAKSTCHVLKSNLSAPDLVPSDDASSIDSRKATDAEVIKQLRADLVQALQKVDQSAQVRSNLMTCQSELHAVKLLYEGAKAATAESEARATAMMKQLVELSSGVPASSVGNHEIQDLQEQLAKVERKLKKISAERDASRDVLKDAESELEDQRRRHATLEAAIAEVRLENTKLREGVGSKGKDKEQIATLHASLQERDSKIEQLREQREQYRAELSKIKAKLEKSEQKDQPLKLASHEELPGNVSIGRRRGLSNRNAGGKDIQATSPQGI